MKRQENKTKTGELTVGGGGGEIERRGEGRNRSTKTNLPEIECEDLSSSNEDDKFVKNVIYVSMVCHGKQYKQ